MARLPSCTETLLRFNKVMSKYFDLINKLTSQYYLPKRSRYENWHFVTENNYWMYFVPFCCALKLAPF